MRANLFHPKVSGSIQHPKFQVPDATHVVLAKKNLDFYPENAIQLIRLHIGTTASPSDISHEMSRQALHRAVVSNLFA